MKKLFLLTLLAICSTFFSFSKETKTSTFPDAAKTETPAYISHTITDGPVTLSYERKKL